MSIGEVVSAVYDNLPLCVYDMYINLKPSWERRQKVCLEKWFSPSVFPWACSVRISQLACGAFTSRSQHLLWRSVLLLTSGSVAGGTREERHDILEGVILLYSWGCSRFFSWAWIRFLTFLIGHTGWRKALGISHTILAEEKVLKVSYSFSTVLPSLLLVKLPFLPNINYLQFN